MFAANGMSGTEAVPTFLEDAAVAVPTKMNVMVICDSGGQYTPTLGGSREVQPRPNSMTALLVLCFSSSSRLRISVQGKRSRSLIACYKLLEQAGFQEVTHVSGGIRQWAQEGLPLEGDDTDAWVAQAGKMP